MSQMKEAFGKLEDKEVNMIAHVWILKRIFDFSGAYDTRRAAKNIKLLEEFKNHPVVLAEEGNFKAETGRAFEHTLKTLQADLGTK